MSEAVSEEGTRLERATDAALSLGRPVFSLANIALGIETLVCARSSIELGPRYIVIPVLPFLPAIPWLASLFGAIWVARSVGLLSKRTVRTAAIALGSLLLLCTLA